MWKSKVQQTNQKNSVVENSMEKLIKQIHTYIKKQKKNSYNFKKIEVKQPVKIVKRESWKEFGNEIKEKYNTTQQNNLDKNQDQEDRQTIIYLHQDDKQERNTEKPRRTSSMKETN